MKPLLTSISATLDYARYFDYDLTFEELHHWLISPKPVTLSSLKRTLNSAQINLPSRPTRKRRLRQTLTDRKLFLLPRLLFFFSFFPSLKLVALSGSLAMGNAKKEADLDLFIITSSHTLWLTRLLIIPTLRLFFPARTPHTPHAANTVCPNLWLDQTSLSLPRSKRSLYTAHEVLQIKPLLNRGHTYEQFIRANSWAKTHLANAYQKTISSFSPSSTKRNISKWGSFLLSPFNLLAYLIQYLYMRPKITTETITLHSAYFHPRTLNPSQKADSLVK